MDQENGKERNKKKMEWEKVKKGQVQILAYANAPN